MVDLGHVLSLITRLCSIGLDTFYDWKTLESSKSCFYKNYFGGGGNVGIGVAFPGNKWLDNPVLERGVCAAGGAAGTPGRPDTPGIPGTAPGGNNG